jgi:hypothetical protein
VCLPGPVTRWQAGTAAVWWHDQGRRRSPHAAAGQRGRLNGPGNAEIDHARAFCREQHVGRLEIPVHHTGRVNGLQSFGYAGHQ